MKITQLKINGITNPVGFCFRRVKCSWKVRETAARRQVKARIDVSLAEDFREILYCREGADLASSGTLLEILPAPYTRYYYRVCVWGDNGESGISDTAWFETGKMNEPWTAEYIGTAEEDTFHPVFQKAFRKPAHLDRARIYITGLGLYEAYLNGSKIGNDFLAPFCNDYHKQIQVQTYDVTDLLEEHNEIRIYCGNGWYKGRLGYDGDREHYGNRFGTIAEIHMWDKSGRDTVIGTDASWTYQGSDVLDSDLYDGEILDRTYWSLRENPLRPVQVLPLDKSRLVGRYSLPVIVKETIAVQKVIHTPAGETVLDMGQNFAGFMTFRAAFAPGTRIVLDYGEILQNGNFYNGNYRTARAQFVYVSDGRREIARPHFTYYGFRYVRVSGWPGEIHPGDFTGCVVYSDLDSTIEFSSDHPKLNRLQQNCLWGQKSNFLDMPTDCPQRDERLGWTGDAQVFAPTACYHMDTRAFYHKYLTDLYLDQLDHGGAVANYIPNNCRIPSGSSVWGDAVTFLPMTLYAYYGDADDLSDYYPSMKAWVDYLIRGDAEHGGRHLWDYGFHFGDWLAMDGITPHSMKGGTDDYYIASVYYYASVRKLARAAEILGYSDDVRTYRKQAEQIYQAILREYFSENGRLCIDTQTGYLLSLRFGIYRDKDRIIRGMKERLRRDCYRIKGGFVGATAMCQTLAENGMGDIACYLLFQEGFPGWMHCVNLGATTIWERWNSVLDDGTINGTGMNSLNHYAYGSVMEYVYRYLAGLQPLEPGFLRVRFAPQPNCRLKHVHLSYDSVNGIYVSDWRVHADGRVTVHFEVPFNCHAEAILPGTDHEVIPLEAGVFERTYMPSVDYRQKYTMDTRLAELSGDERAVQILKEEMPSAAALIAHGDPEELNLSLNDLRAYSFLGFRPDQLQRASRKLFEIRT